MRKSSREVSSQLNQLGSIEAAHGSVVELAQDRESFLLPLISLIFSSSVGFLLQLCKLVEGRNGRLISGNAGTLALTQQVRMVHYDGTDAVGTASLCTANVVWRFVTDILEFLVVAFDHCGEQLDCGDLSGIVIQAIEGMAIDLGHSCRLCI